MCLKRWHGQCRSLCKVWDEYCAGYQTRTVFFPPLRERLPLDSARHWKKVSDKRTLLRPGRKVLSLASATPVDDEDTKSSENESKLKQQHLWNGLGNIGVAILTNPNLKALYLSWHQRWQTFYPSLIVPHHLWASDDLLSILRSLHIFMLWCLSKLE